MQKPLLIPTVVQGEMFNRSAAFNCLRDVKDGYVQAIEFINQGVDSTVTIEFPGGQVVLAPGDDIQGSSWKVCQPDGGYDTTEYKISFSIGGTTPNCVVVVMKVLKDCVDVCKAKKC